MGEPGGSLTGTIGGAPFDVRVSKANFQENQTSFLIDGIDTTSFSGESLSLGLTIDRELMGVGQFDCSVLGEAGISAAVPVASGYGDVTSTYVRSKSGFECTIFIDEFGNVGEPIKGSFSGDLIESGNLGMHISGTIDVIRGSVVLNNE